MSPQIKTETQWGNNVIINVHVHVADGQVIPDSFFTRLRDKFLNAVKSHGTAAAVWEEHDKTFIYNEKIES